MTILKTTPFRRRLAWAAGAIGVLTLAACASLPSPAELDDQARQMMKAAFRDEGIAKVDRLNQDGANEACSQALGGNLNAAAAEQIEAAQLKLVKSPSDGNYLGDWKEGEKIAQSGRGLTFTDDAKAANGGNCYNCHQVSKEEISFGTIGPSLYQYGKLRGVTDPKAAATMPIVEYTWGKLWNARAYNACSSMPRFGHMGILNETQIRHVMALLLDPASPVNK